MTIEQEKAVKEIITRMAEKEGVCVERVRSKIQVLIDEGFQSDDLNVQTQYQMLFNGRKPTIDEFVLSIMQVIKKCAAEAAPEAQ